LEEGPPSPTFSASRGSIERACSAPPIGRRQLRGRIGEGLDQEIDQAMEDAEQDKEAGGDDE